MIYVLNFKYLRENFILNMLSGFIFYKRIYPAVLFIKNLIFPNLKYLFKKKEQVQNWFAFYGPFVQKK